MVGLPTQLHPKAQGLLPLPQGQERPRTVVLEPGGGEPQRQSLINQLQAELSRSSLPQTNHLPKAGLQELPITVDGGCKLLGRPAPCYQHLQQQVGFGLRLHVVYWVTRARVPKPIHHHGRRSFGAGTVATRTTTA